MRNYEGKTAATTYDYPPQYKSAFLRKNGHLYHPAWDSKVPIIVYTKFLQVKRWRTKGERGT